jgi:outer membrane protein assembly factor BamB
MMRPSWWKVLVLGTMVCAPMREKIGSHLCVWRVLVSWAMVCAAVAAVLLAAGDVSAQAKRPGRADSDSGKDKDEADENVFVRADRLTLQKLTDAKKLLAEDRLGEAVRYLGEILESAEEDYFLPPDKASAVGRSLRSEATRLVGELPRAGRELYELQFGARARRMLEEATATGNAARLADVARRFYYTHSGCQAAFLLGLDYFNRGQPEMAATCLQRLRESGQSAVEEFEPALSLTIATCWLQSGATAKAKETLTSLRERHPTARVLVAGREVAMFAAHADPVEWLGGLIGPLPADGSRDADGWRMFRGDPLRNAASSGGAPLLNARWRVRLADDPAVQSALEQSERSDIDRGGPTVSSCYPLAVGDVLLMRTLHNLAAVDFATGKQLWEAPDDDGEEGLPGNDPESRQRIGLSSVDQRMRNDLTYGTLSSDGRCVFSVEDSPLAAGGQRGNQIARRRNLIQLAQPIGGEEQGPAHNRLAAYEIRTGRLAWQLGGPTGEHALRQAETFFLGPPLPLWGQLYVLAEVKSEIRLLALDGVTGDLLWSQQLATAEQDPLRCWSGLSPSYADGVLVCPTSASAIVGVDLAARSLVWGYQYVQYPSLNGRRDRGMLNARASYAGGAAMPHWLDAGVSIVDGRVLATPQESDSLHCLNLSNGKLLWKCRRVDDLYVACADREKVVLVGRRSLRAVQLANGKAAWDGRKAALPDSSSPSGRGFVSGQHYFLPLGNAEVVSVDLDAGKIAQTAKSRKGDVPGNLICYRGWVVSQGLGGMEAYYQLDSASAEIERRLKANPDDAEALSLRGETLLDSGNRAEAVASFRRAYALKAEPRTRALLRDALLEGLQTEFAVYRDRHEELERLLDDPSQQAGYLRLMIGGLQQDGQPAAAFDYCQKLIDLAPEQPPLDQVGKMLATRRDRWVQNRLAELRRAATGDTAAKIDAAIETRWKAALATGSIDRLQQFLAYFDHQPIAATARGELVARLKEAHRLSEAELLVWSDAHSPSAGDRATATARIAELLGQAGRAADTAACYWALGRQFAEVKCYDGRTGKQWLDAHADDDALRQLQTRRQTTWPTGYVDSQITKVKTPDNSGGYGPYPVEWRGDPGPFFADVLLAFDQVNHTLIARDGWGRELWRIALPSENIDAFNAEGISARASGHFLLVSLGEKIVAVDTLIADANAAPKLLWSRSVTGPDNEPVDAPAVRGRMGRLPPVQFAQFPFPGTPTYGRPAPPLGPVTSRYVCFRRGHSLLALDPQTGAVLWTRQDVPPGNELFGDEDYVFVVSPTKEDATLLRAVDGEVAGTRKIPRMNGQQTLVEAMERDLFVRMDEAYLGSFGRRLLSWRPEKNARELAFFDALDGKDAWPRRKFAFSAHAAVLGDEAVGVFEPNGRFTLVALADGRTIAEVKLDSEPSLVEITLFAIGDQYFLLTNSSVGKQSNFGPIGGLSRKSIQSGRLYAFDKQGALQWKAAAIKGQCLLTHQPACLPVLTFAANGYDQKANGQSQAKLSVLCIDKRNGRTAYKHEFSQVTQNLLVTGDVEKRDVDLTMQQNAVTLRFTDDPAPPPSAVGKSAQPPAGGKTVHAIWDSLQKTFGRIMDESSPEDEK